MKRIPSKSNQDLFLSVHPPKINLFSGRDIVSIFLHPPMDSGSTFSFIFIENIRTIKKRTGKSKSIA